MFIQSQLSRHNEAALAHIERACAAAAIQDQPFPHIVIDEILPWPYFELLENHLPRESEFQIQGGFGHIKIEETDDAFRKLGRKRKTIWRHFDVQIKAAACAGLARRFAPYASEKLCELFGQGGEDLTTESYAAQRGIIQCRTRGAIQHPHLDKATTLFTYLFYFSKDEKLAPHGTTLYETGRPDTLLEAYRERADVRVWYPDVTRFAIKACRKVDYRPNRLIAFINLSRSLHGTWTEAPVPRFSMQTYCELPPRAQALFLAWSDSLTPGQAYAGGL